MSQSTGMPEPDVDELQTAVERLLDETVDREDSLDVAVEDLEVDIPIYFGEDSPRAKWRFNGDVTVTVDGIRAPLREWFDLHGEQPTSSGDGD
ncbi:hypothetical protein NDI56_00360 [Haloarcula sp. S1CR25-12]|uniref:Amphi-Trp domain-containing protein n=1 Tax=Haloarcula saliterrae TaxID=2950534 RepID=A0ABU2F7D6_9EURY|nr:hypothetical protein [Haloarcula sp. S1CR25-12]MDS0257853.1 hypothetical protein [Haloarcula sp. S1CR25-12]